MNLKLGVLCTALTVGALAGGPAQAGLVTYTEASGGDLSDGNPLQVFTLDAAGINTIAGAMGFDETGFDGDAFALQVAPGFEIVALSVLNPNSPTTWRVGNGLLYGDGSEIGRLAGSASLPADVFPLTGALNVVALRSGLRTAYTFSIETRAVTTGTVPEPAMPVLLALCAAAMALTRRRA